MTLDQSDSRAKGCLQSEQTRMGTSGNDPIIRLRNHHDVAVSFDSGFLQSDLLLSLSTHALHRISPQFENLHIDLPQEPTRFSVSSRFRVGIGLGYLGVDDLRKVDVDVSRYP